MGRVLWDLYRLGFLGGIVRHCVGGCGCGAQCRVVECGTAHCAPVGGLHSVDFVVLLVFEIRSSQC
jgi:hypothetical protein